MLLNMYTCKETLQRLDDYLDRELTEREQQLVQRHLKICRHCAAKFGFEARLLAKMRARLQDTTLPPNLLADISQTLKELQVLENSSLQDAE